MRSNVLPTLLIASALFGGGCASASNVAVQMPTSALDAPSGTTTAATTSVSSTVSTITMPIDRASERVTKKPFGLYVSPKNSPVSPERFTGFHTGVDFEALPEGSNNSVSVQTICAGPLVLKKWSTGYGGVAVQRCTLDGKPVTVIYGHLSLASVVAKVGQELNQGDMLGVLGKGYTTETDGERTNLHLGIHKGTSINILGYVQDKAELVNWIDVRTLLFTK